MNAPHQMESQRGVAAVELALVLFSASLLLAALLFCARLGWQALALHRAGIGTPINPLAIGIQCDGSGCGSTVQPQSLTFYALMPVAVDGIGDGLVFYMLGATSMDILANETVPYAP
jgi:hypothetical protein